MKESANRNFSCGPGGEDKKAYPLPAQAQCTRSGIPLHNFVFALAALSCVIWMGTSIFIPGLPHIGRELGMDRSELGLTLTLYYLSFALLMPVVGPLSDIWGRRGFVMAGLVLFFCGSLACALAGTEHVFYAGRVVQGLGVGMVQVPTLAMVRDECPGSLSYRVLGLLGALTGIIPVVSMLAGGLLIQWISWRSVFYILAGAAVLSGAVCRWQIPETLSPEKRLRKINFRNHMAVYRSVLFSGQVGLVTMPLLLSVVFQGAYLVIAPFAFEQQLGKTPAQFALANIFIVFSMAAGQYIATLAVRRFNPRYLYPAGGLPALAGGILFSVLFLTIGIQQAVMFIAPLALFAFSFGFMEPIGLKSLFARFDQVSGMASAVYGTLLLAMQGAGSMAAGMLLNASWSPSLAMTMIILPLGIAIMALSWAGRRRIC